MNKLFVCVFREVFPFYHKRHGAKTVCSKCLDAETYFSEHTSRSYARGLD